MIYVSSIFMTKGYYDFATMMQVYTLVLFSVTFASQFLDFSTYYQNRQRSFQALTSLYSCQSHQWPRAEWRRLLSVA